MFYFVPIIVLLSENFQGIFTCDILCKEPMEAHAEMLPFVFCHDIQFVVSGFQTADNAVYISEILKDTP